MVSLSFPKDSDLTGINTLKTYANFSIRLIEVFSSPSKYFAKILFG